AIVYLDGQALSGLDEYHRSALLPQQTHDGEHDLLIRCYTPYRQPFGGLSLKLRDETIFRLGQAMRAALEAVETYRDSDLAKHDLLARLNDAYNALDLREGYQSERFAESAATALERLNVGTLESSKAGTADSTNVPTFQPSNVPTIIATGHAHLDVAW